MDTTLSRVRQAPAWLVTLACCLPLWLFALAVASEGFPRPPLPYQAGLAVFFLGIAVSVVLIVLRWLTPELILVSVLPFFFLYPLDEISTAYKTPIILACTLVLTAGIVLARSTPRRAFGLVILLVAAGLVLVMVGAAAENYWTMHGQVLDSLGGGPCYMDGYGCPQFTGQETPWYLLFFHP